MRKYILSLLLSLLTLSSYSAENINFKTIDVKDGLFSNFIHCIVQDRYGLMWIHSKNMLSSYDGYTFKQYSTSIQDGSFIPMINEDKNGILWLKLSNNYLIYDREKDTWTEDISLALPKGTNISDIEQLFVDHDGNIWISYSDNTLFYFDLENNISSQFTLNQKIKWLDCRDKHGYALLEGACVKELDVEANQVNNVLDLPLSNYTHQKIYIDYSYNLWFYALHSSEDPLLLYDFIDNELITLNDNGQEFRFVTDVIDDKQGNIWIGTDNSGISIYNTHKGTFSHIKADSNNEFSLPSNHINSFFLDNQNIMWVGTSKRGLAYANLNNASFNYHTISNFDDISCILEDKEGNIWLGSDGYGIARIDSKTNSTSYFTTQNSPIPNNLIICSYLDSKDRLWFGSYGRGLVYYKDGQFHTPNLDWDKVANNPLKEINVIKEDSYGNIWIGTIISGLYCYSADGKFSSYTVENGSISTNCITDIFCEHSSRNVYIATTQGLYTIDCHTRNISAFNKTNKEPIISIYKDSRGLIWMGTEKGLDIYSEKQDTLIHLNTINGLSHNYIRAICEDKDRNIWITTDNGVSNIIVIEDPLRAIPIFRPYRYFDEDGISDIAFNSHSIFCRQNGEILMGGIGGVTSILPNKTMVPQVHRDVKFTALYIGGKRIDLDKNLMLTDEITLDYSNNNFSIGVSSLNYSTHKTQFSYRLLGYTDWTNFDGNIITFNKLEPRTYLLEVKNNDYLQSETEISSLIINIKPPFSRSSTAKVLYLLIFCTIISLVILYVRRKSKLKKQHEIDEAQMRFFTNISHDLRTPLSLIITPLDKLISSQKYDSPIKEDLMMMRRNASLLMDEINQVLVLRKFDNGKAVLKLSNGNLSSFVDSVCRSFEPYSKKQNIVLETRLSSNPIIMDFDSKIIQRILMNLLSNAFKFNIENGSVIVSLERIGDYVQLIVSDTGIGISDENKERVFERFYQETQVKDHIGSGVGLHIVQECVKLHGGSISVADNCPRGSVFTVLLPYHCTVATEQEGELTLPDTNMPILVVEDNDDFRHFLVNCLKEKYNVISAPDGQKALSIIEQKPVRLIISDIMMPVMDGLTLCKNIKGNIQFSHIPIILLTAKAADEHILEGLTEGADDYITKPFNIDILLIRIQKLLDRSAANHQKFSTIEIEPSEITISSLDEQLISKAIKLVEENIDNTDFTVEDLSSAIGMTRGHLYKKMMAITGKSPFDFIRTIRIKRGKQLLEKSQKSISEIAYQVGLSPKQFSLYFKEAYGKLPSEFKKESLAK